ncbi:MAG: phosphoglycerate dehydrogenase [Chloroflexi bacterium]|nr:phosphoglycerate dehydrogenase [Chloroflexota bacterium]
MKILVSEPLEPAALALLAERHEVDARQGLSPAELREIIPRYDALIVRSATKVNRALLERATNLKLVARAGIGVDNIDVAAATERGIVVVNAPNENVTAVAEHTLGLMLALSRHVARADASLRAGKWQRSQFEGGELFGKTLGIVGLGKIGGEVARRALAFGMEVVAADPLVSPERAAELGVRLVSMDDLLATADYVSLHVPGGQGTRGLLGAKELARVKPGCRIINCARGGVIDETALLDAIAADRVAGAALDVFAAEPPADPRLLAEGRVLLTPHIGGSTAEARVNVGLTVAREALAVLAGLPPANPVNLPALSPREWQALKPMLALAERLGVVARGLLAGQLRAIAVQTEGAYAERPRQLLAAAALRGLLANGDNGAVNLVNARAVAATRGLRLYESYTADEECEPGLALRLETTEGQNELHGGLTRGVPHVLRVDDYWLSFPAQGNLLFGEYSEGRGVLSSVTRVLAEGGVSISFVQLGRRERGGRGLMVLGLDDACPAPVLAALRALPSALWVREVALPANGD